MAKTPEEWKSLWESYLEALEVDSSRTEALEDLELKTRRRAPVPPKEIRNPCFSSGPIGATAKFKDGESYVLIDEEDIRKAFVTDRDAGIVAAEVYRDARLKLLEQHRADVEAFEAKVGITAARLKSEEAYRARTGIEREICESPATCMEGFAAKLGMWRREILCPFKGPAAGERDFDNPGDVAVFQAYKEVFNITRMKKDRLSAESDPQGALSASVWFGA